MPSYPINYDGSGGESYPMVSDVTPTSTHNGDEIRGSLETQPFLSSTEVDSLPSSVAGHHRHETDQYGSETKGINGRHFDHQDHGRRIVNDRVHHNLISIPENESVREMTPRFPMVTNNLTVGADESFLSTSQNSLWDDQGKRAGTMHNLHERASFLNLTSGSTVGKALQRALVYLKDDFGSMAALNVTAIKEQDKRALVDDHKPIQVVPSGGHMKNLLAISTTIALLLISLGSVRNLQSSINYKGGIGVICLAISFVGYTLGGFFSGFLIQNLPPRRCFIASLVPHILYVASNIHPALWLMAPIAFVQGASFSVAWNTLTTYVSALAKGQAEKENELYPVVSSRYFGIFGIFYQSYYITGNLIGSLILQFGSQSEPGENQLSPEDLHNSTYNSSDTTSLTNISSLLTQTFNLTSDPSVNTEFTDRSKYLHLCGANFWQHYDLGGSHFDVSDQTKYLLYGVYILILFIALAIAFFVVEDLNPRLFDSDVPGLDKLKSQVLDLWHIFKDPKFLLLFPIQIYSFMSVGFIISEVSKAFVSCPLDIYMVGYTMMAMGVTGSLVSYISGLLQKVVSRLSLLVFAAVLNIGVLIFLLLWQPTLDSLAPYFILMALLGTSDGIWVSQINSCLCAVFPQNYEVAFAGLRVGQGLGACVIFFLSNPLRMDQKTYFIGAFLIVGMAGYLIVELMMRNNAKKLVRLLRQTSV